MPSVGILPVLHQVISSQEACVVVQRKDPPGAGGKVDYEQSKRYFASGGQFAVKVWHWLLF